MSFTCAGTAGNCASHPPVNRANLPTQPELKDQRNAAESLAVAALARALAAEDQHDTVMLENERLRESLRRLQEENQK